jgi:hypothetical protein
MLIRALALGSLVMLATASAKAQPLSAYVSMQNQVVVWDNGIIRTADYLPPTDYKIGRTAVPFLDNTRSFKIYYGGGVRVINNGFTNDFKATDNLVAYTNAKSLNVFDRGATKNLTPLCNQYLYGDSVILFLDGIRNEYKAYYNGTVYPVENFLADDAITNAKVSDNIAAYVNYANQFRIFYHGELLRQEDYTVQSFGVGRNTVAYVDANRRFRVFMNGKTQTLDEYAPLDYQVGDNLVAFTTNDGYFKVYYGDSIRTIGFFRPEYQVGDNIVGYRDAGGYFRVFYRGDLYTLDNYYPGNYTVQYNSVAYVNRANTLRMFSDGEVYDVTSGSDAWVLNYDVLRYSLGTGVFRIYYKGQEY